MIGHTVDTYHDIESLGLEKLRNIYTGADLSIRPKTQVSKIDPINEIMWSIGESPERILSRGGPARRGDDLSGPERLKDRRIEVLSRTLRELVESSAARARAAMRSGQSLVRHGGTGGVYTRTGSNPKLKNGTLIIA